MVNDLKNIDGIIGVIVPKLNIPDLKFNIDLMDNKILKLCMLDKDNIPLTSKNISKLQLANNINNKEIILYDFSKGLNNKEISYFQRLFKKMIINENKKIILISRDIDFIAKICNNFVIYTNKIIYFTNDIFDKKLYKYIDMPKIVKFIKLSNDKGIKLKNTTDINELIKDIFRRKNENKTSL